MFVQSVLVTRRRPTTRIMDMTGEKIYVIIAHLYGLVLQPSITLTSTSGQGWVEGQVYPRRKFHHWHYSFPHLTNTV